MGSPNCTYLFLAVSMLQQGQPICWAVGWQWGVFPIPSHTAHPSHGLFHFLPFQLPLCCLECGCPCHSVGRLLPRALRRVDGLMEEDVAWFLHPLVRLWWLSFVTMRFFLSSIINKAQMFALYKMTLCFKHLSCGYFISEIFNGLKAVARFWLC